MITKSAVAARDSYPVVIQGGMGIGVSGWELAGAVGARGQLGVVSGTALDTVIVRILQSGDPGGHVRRALSRFPYPELADRVLSRYFFRGGIGAGSPWKLVPMYTLRPTPELQALSVVSTFAEVWLAKERAGTGRVGINYLYKVKMPLLPSMYGALLAGVDFVIVGAGQPKDIPRALTGLAGGEDQSLDIDVLYADSGERRKIAFSPRAILGGPPPSLARPKFLAIVSSVDQAEGLSSLEDAPDGYVFEGASAGGHNAPPRGPRRLSAAGEPVYGPSDELDFSALRRLEVPYWLAGSQATAEALLRAQTLGAVGIQVGTAFAFCRESGLASSLKRAILRCVVERRAKVFTHPRASPTGFPFKVVQLEGSLSDDAVHAARKRICDIGLLRVPFESKNGSLGYRCSAEPERAYVAKRGRPEQVEGRRCLCNALLANIGLGQLREGRLEPPLVTAGDDLVELGRLLPRPSAGVWETETSYGADDVLDHLLRPSGPSAEPGASASVGAGAR